MTSTTGHIIGFSRKLSAVKMIVAVGMQEAKMVTRISSTKQICRKQRENRTVKPENLRQRVEHFTFVHIPRSGSGLKMKTTDEAT